MAYALLPMGVTYLASLRSEVKRLYMGVLWGIGRESFNKLRLCAPDLVGERVISTTFSGFRCVGSQQGMRGREN